MPGETTTTLDAILKEVYAKPLQMLLVKDNPVLDLFEKVTGNWGGRKIVYPVQVRRNQAAMGTTDSGTLPDAGSVNVQKVGIAVKFIHGRIQLSIQIIRASRQDEFAFKKGVNLAMSDMIDAVRRYRNRAMFGTGRGILAVFNGDPGVGTTWTVKNPGGVAGATNGARFLQIGQVLAAINPTGPAIRAGGQYTVTAIASDGTNVTVSPASDAAIADLDFIVRAAKTTSTGIGDTGIDNDPMGLLGLVDDSTFVTTLHEISRATYPIWGSQVFPNVGALSADIIQRAIDVAYERGDGRPDCLVCGPGVRRAYLTLMEADRRYIGTDLRKPDLGTVAAKLGQITFGEIPMIIDRDAPYGYMFVIDKSGFTRWVEVEGEWADDDGTILHRIVDVDAFEARYRVFDQFSNDYPNKCSRLDAITTTEVVVHID